MNYTRQEIVAKASEYLTHCLGCNANQPLLIATTKEEQDVANIFWDAKKHGKTRTVEATPLDGEPHRLLQTQTGEPLAIMYPLTRNGKLGGGVHLKEWQNLIQEYKPKHALGFIDRQQGELAWRIGFIGTNISNQMIYGHGPGTTMDHMKGHFMIDYKKAASFGQNLISKLNQDSIVGYYVTSPTGTKYFVAKDKFTNWSNDLMPRPHRNTHTGKMQGDVGNVPGGEVYEESTIDEFIPKLDLELGIMTKRPAFGYWVADLSVGSVKESLRETGDKAILTIGRSENGPFTKDLEGVVTNWSSSSPSVQEAMQQEINGDPYAKKGLIIQESLAFGFNEKANPETDDLLEGEKARALHIGFGGKLSHIDLLMGMEGANVFLMHRDTPLSIQEINFLIHANLLPRGTTREQIVKNGEYTF